MSVHIQVPVGDLQGNMAGSGKPSASASSFDWTSALKNATTSISPSALWILVRTEMRPWSEFVRPANFTKPTDGSSLVALQRVITDRLLINGLHFRYNYALVSCVLMLYSLLTSPLLLIVVIASGYGQLYIRNNAASTSIQVFGRTLNASQQHIALAVITAPVLYLLGAGDLLFWVVGASAFVCGLHAVCYNVDAVRRVQGGEQEGFGYYSPDIVQTV